MSLSQIDNAPAKIYANAHIFADLLAEKAEGYALWHPTTAGRIGDCGTISGGCFEPTFNVYKDPPGLTRPLSPPSESEYAYNRTEDNIAALCSTTSASVTFDGTAKVDPAVVPINVEFSVKWDRHESSLAYLQFRGKDRLTVKLGKKKRDKLEQYVQEHTPEICERFSPGDKIIFVLGVTRAAGWISAVAHRSGTQVRLSAGLSGSFARLGISWGRTRNMDENDNSNPMLVPAVFSTKCAPPVDESGVPPPRSYYDHSIIVQPLRLERQLFSSIRRRIKVSVDDSQSETTGPDARPSTTSNLSITSSLHVQCKAPVVGTENKSSAGGVQREAYPSKGSEDTGPELDGPGIAETASEGWDLLSIILRRILFANTNIAAVLGTWDDLEDFRRDYGELGGDTDFTAELSVNERNKTARLVKLMNMNSGGEGHEVEHGHLVDAALATSAALTPHHDLSESGRSPNLPKAEQYEGTDATQASSSSPVVGYESSAEDMWLPFTFVPLVPARRYQGRFSTVQIYSCKGTVAETLVAIKRAIPANEDSLDDFDREMKEKALQTEITVLRYCRHENILGFLGLTREHLDVDAQPLIVTPYAKNGTLRHYVRAEANADADRRKLLCGVAAGLRYLHTPRVMTGKTVIIVHGDIHPGHVLIMEDGRPVLSGFGLSEIVEEGSLAPIPILLHGTAMGVAQYTAPELHDTTTPEIVPGAEYDRRRSVKSDIFAFGMLVFDVYGGNAKRVLGKHAASIVWSLIQGARPGRQDVARQDFPSSYWDIIENCWKHDAAKRPTVEEVFSALQAEI